MLLSEIHGQPQGEVLTEDLKTAIMSAALAVAAAFTPLAQAQDKVEQQFPNVQAQKVDAIVTQAQKLFDAQVAQYMKDNDIKDKSELNSGDYAVIKTKTSEQLKKFMASVR